MADPSAALLMQLSPSELHPLSDNSGYPAYAGPTWRVTRNVQVDIGALVPGCAGVPHWSAGWDRVYEYESPSAFVGWVDLRTIVTTTAAEGAAESAATATQAYWQCYADSKVRPDVSAQPTAAISGSTSITREPLSVVVPSVTVLFTTPYTQMNARNSARVATVDYRVVTWLAYGRYRAVFDVDVCCTQTPIADIQPDVVQIAERMKGIADGPPG